MTGRVLELNDVIQPDQMAVRIAERWVEWDLLRENKKKDWEELRRYVYATDTTQTTNSQLPWKNKTTIPKLCQIRDSLYSNYVASMFPQRKWLIWSADEKKSDSVLKRDSIVNYMSWAIEQPSFKNEIDKIVLDYIDFGNCFATFEWLDQRVERESDVQTGFVGPAARRISPLDIVFNPVAENFESSPKIIRSLVSIGELRELLQRMSTDENIAEYEELWKYFRDIRGNATSFEGEWLQKDNLYQVDGFTSFRDYLRSDIAEILTFYGDLYDPLTDMFYKNHVITIVDRHKLIGNKPNPSFFGYPPIFHTSWRKKQDNLWGMGPLDNLVGLQYRMDHVENMKADVFDLITFPVQKVKGFVEAYTWQPGEKIFLGDEGDVDLVVPHVNALQANFEIQNIERLMEEMAGAPREAMGFRTPGEKTKYEVQRLENAAARIFQNKIRQFEEQLVEPLLNSMLELARRNLSGTISMRIFDDELKVASFQDLSPEDITGVGRIRPIAARHFAEQAELIQNITNLTNSNLWPTVQMHFSSVKLAKILEDIFNLKDYGVVLPYVSLSERADAQKYMNVLEEQIAMETSTTSGIGEDLDLSEMDQMMNMGKEQTKDEENTTGLAA